MASPKAIFPVINKPLTETDFMLKTGVFFGNSSTYLRVLAVFRAMSGQLRTGIQLPKKKN
jgi:hypothetical protein